MTATRCRTVVLAGTWTLAAIQVVAGAWALAAPRSFFDAFPFGGIGWVGLLPPFNEHLVRDVGGLNLALVVVLAAAALRADRGSVRVAVAALLVFAVPHAVFHQTHLEQFPPAIAVAQAVGVAAQLVLTVVVLILARHLRPAGNAAS